MKSKQKLKPREVQNKNRFETVHKSSGVLLLFMQRGFMNFDAVKAIVLNYYPTISEARLWQFWHFRIFDNDIADALLDVSEKLKCE
jgi:hypothetical protein